jgi:hypothetical protein
LTLAGGQDLPDRFAFVRVERVLRVGAFFAALRPFRDPARQVAVSLPGVAATEVPFGEPDDAFFSASRSESGIT